MNFFNEICRKFDEILIEKICQIIEWFSSKIDILTMFGKIQLF